MDLKATIIVTLATISLIKCIAVNAPDCSQDVPCPDIHLPITCQDGSVNVNRQVYRFGNQTIYCEGCPVCTNDITECPNIPMRRNAPEALVDLSHCRTSQLYSFRVDLSNGEDPCFAGESYTCEPY